MMSGVNKAIIVGRLGNDPEMRQIPNGDPVANISVATSEVWNDKQTGERREVTEWHRIVFYRRQAEICAQYLKKGSQVYVEGKLKTRKWQDQNGQDRSITEIQGDVLKMLSSNQDNQQSRTQNQGWDGYADHERIGGKPQAQKPVTPTEPVVDNFDDDIPFASYGHGLSRSVIYAI